MWSVTSLARAISSPWPHNPNPVTSVMAWTSVRVPIDAPPVQQRRGRQHLHVTRAIQSTLSEGIRIDPNADGLSQDQRISGSRTGIASDPVRRRRADDGEP